MGEAFGKSFQYGKRKISSLSNEEFNKLTFKDLMDDQTANIRTIIPSLSEQMDLSFHLQVHIFDEMIKLVPAFFQSLMNALGPIAAEFNSFGTTPFNQTIPNPDQPTLVTHQENPQDFFEASAEESGWSYTQIAALGSAQIKQKLKDGVFKGTEISAANGILKDRADSNTQTETTTPTFTATEQTAVQWQKELDQQLTLFVQAKADLQKNPSRASSKAKKSNAAKAIRALSNDYRSPNNIIRNGALALRQQIASGLLK